MSEKINLKKHLCYLYPKEGEQICNEILNLVASHSAEPKVRRRKMTEKDLLLIAYPHQIQNSKSGKKPLTVLSNFYNKELSSHFSGIHLLPFYPSTSDGGFAVSDYNEVDPSHGTWQDIKSFEGDLMFDAVFNHTSSEHSWFQSWLKGDPHYDSFYHYTDQLPEPGSKIREQLDMVTRPRSSDLLQAFDRQGEKVYVWATFGPDQLDANFANPKVLLEFVRSLMLYIENGATLLRVDAVPFLWKELGTNCVHLEQTHTLVKVFRAVLDLIEPETMIVTESNVPHQENISYLSDGTSEAQMIYNFSLAPLILYSLIEGNANRLKEWVANLAPLHPENYFFNFTATHDGIGVRPLEGILNSEEIHSLAQKLESLGGMVSYRDFEGQQKPYEVNITWASALSHDQIDLHIQRIITSYAMSFVFPGVPGVYFHNLVGTKNWEEGYRKTQHKRDVNRLMYDEPELIQLISDHPYHSQIYEKTLELLEKRRNTKCLHPSAQMTQLETPDHVWGIERSFEEEKGQFLFNLSDQEVDLPEFNKKLGPYEFSWKIS